MSLRELVATIGELRGVKHKLDIQCISRSYAKSAAIVNGDDCAAITDGQSHLLLAIEGIIDEFVQAEPWFAGYCAVMVNVSDVASMGGRPIAVVDALWTHGAGRSGPIWSGMSDAAEKYGVPIVGGHTNTRSSADHLAVAILGRAGSRLLTSHDAMPGDLLIAAIDLRGEWFGQYPYWNASTTAPGERLRNDLEILPRLAESDLCAAGKDISMGGLIGTATMFAECSEIGMCINVNAVPRPPEVSVEKWLASFPSYGFILAARPENADDLCRRFQSRSIAAAVVGTCDDTRTVMLTDGARGSELFWDLRTEPFIGFGKPRSEST
jgi:AIR synthase-related protein